MFPSNCSVKPILPKWNTFCFVRLDGMENIQYTILIETLPLGRFRYIDVYFRGLEQVPDVLLVYISGDDGS